MISLYANSSISGIKMLSDRYCYFKKWSGRQKISNLAIFFIRKRHTTDEMRLVLTEIVVVILVLVLILLAIINIVL